MSCIITDSDDEISQLKMKIKSLEEMLKTPKMKLVIHHVCVVVRMFVPSVTSILQPLSNQFLLPTVEFGNQPLTVSRRPMPPQLARYLIR